ncbi:ABC transporter permease, partial [uncultured Planktosalinus sp.]|uniref:ABC transporter permease n=1 Tax=uncultured Planktosalinus sp. TaxID=1810935 RepID=UPI0030DCD6A9
MVNRKSTSKAGLNWLFSMALRDGKASSKRLVLFMASIVLGIAAVVAIQSFGESLKDNIALQSKSLMGADFKIDANQEPNQTVISIMDSLGGANAREINFASMASFSSTKATKLVQVRGIEGGFPFYGEMETIPKEAALTYQKIKGAILDATVMLQLGIKVGDSIKLGDISMPVTGQLKSVPGSNAVFSSVAPTVIIPFELIEKTGLIQMGSRIRYEYYFLADENTNLKLLDEQLEPKLDLENADLDTHTATSQRLGSRFDNFGKFLNLVAFIALLLGCVGIVSAIHIYIKEKLKAVAILKCLGATKRQTFLIFLIQIGVLGLIGG